MGEAEIRVARSADVETVASLVAGFRDHLASTTPADAELVARLAPLLEHPDSEVLLAFSGDGVAVGYTLTRFFPSLWFEGVEAFLEDLFIAPEARGGGIGARLVEEVARRARARRVSSISLNTNENNAAAQALYRRAGFQLQSEAVWDGGREVKFTRNLRRV